MSGKKDGDWLKTIHGCTEALHDNSHGLLSVAKALSRVGMRELSEEIYEYSAMISACATNIDRATGQACSEAANRAAQNSITVLTASLAGLAIGSNDPETIKTAKKLAGVE